MFGGFTGETSEFLWNLAFHNERPWFTEHKAQFLRVLKEPFDALAEETLALLSEKYPEEFFRLHISRIYRDARRLYGHGPYKDHLWFTIWTGESGEDNPAFWFEVSAKDYGYGVGFYGMSAGQLEAYRRRIDAFPAELERLAKKIREQSAFRLGGEDYKRPRGDKGELLNPWYNKRSVHLQCRRDFGGELLSPELPHILADAFDFLMPYYRFFRQFSQG